MHAVDTPTKRTRVNSSGGQTSDPAEHGSKTHTAPRGGVVAVRSSRRDKGMHEDFDEWWQEYLRLTAYGPQPGHERPLMALYKVIQDAKLDVEDVARLVHAALEFRGKPLPYRSISEVLGEEG